MIDAEYWKKIAENWAIEDNGPSISIVPKPIVIEDEDETNIKDDELDDILADLGLD